MRSRIPFLIILAALVILIIIIISGSINRLRQVGRTLPSVLRTELQTRLNRQVQVDSVRIIYPNTVIINNLRISDGATFDEGVLLSSERALIELSTLDLVLGRVSVTRSINSISFTNPIMRLRRDPDGMLNISDLLRQPPSPPAQRFRGTVIINSGQLTLIDRAARLRRMPAVNTIRRIEGRLRFFQDRPIQVSLAGFGDANRLSRVGINGRWSSTIPDTRLDLIIRNANAAYWLDYTSDINTWGISRGTFDSEAVIYRLPGNKVTARGSIKLTRATFISRYLALPIEPAAANFRFIGTNISMNVIGTLRRSPVSLRGHIYGLSPARLDLSLQSNRLDISTVQAYIRTVPTTRQIRWTAPAVVQSTIRGLSSNPVVNAVVITPRAVFYDTPVTRLRAQGVYRNGQFNITRVTALTAGGRVNLSGVVDTAPLRIRVTGTASGVSLSAIPNLRSLRTFGSADARFNIFYYNRLSSGRITANISRGRISDLAFNQANADITITGPNTANGTISITEGVISNARIRSGVANVSIAGRRVQISNLSAGAFGGSITARGSVIIGGPVNIRMSAESINLGDMLSVYGYRELTGTADFNGNITGTVNNPVIDGRVTAQNGTFRQTRYILLTGRLIASRQSLAIEDSIIRLPGTDIVTTGRITIARGTAPRIETRIRGRQVDISQILQLIGLPIEATGNATTDIQISGTYPNIQVSGDIYIQNAVIEGIRIDEARATLQSRNRRTIIEQLYARSAEMVVSGSGTIEPDNRLLIDLNGQNLRLSLLNSILNPYITLNGPMDFSGELRGTLQRPSIRGIFSSTAPIINNQQYDYLTAGISWANRTLTLSDASIRFQTSIYNLPQVIYDTSRSNLQINGSIASGSIERIVNLLRNSPVIGTAQGQTLREFLATIPVPFRGSIDASLNLAGIIGNINGSASFTINNAQMGDTVVNSMVLDFITQQSRFLLSRASVAAPGVSFTASAEFINTEPTRLTADLADTQLQGLISILRNAPAIRMYRFGQRLLSAIQDIPQPAVGLINASINLDNLQTGSTGRLSIRSRDLYIEGTRFGNLTADARLIEGTVYIEQFELLPESGRAVIQGSISPQGLLTLTGELTGISISLARPWLHSTQLSGVVNSQFRAEGPVYSPFVSASINVTDLQTDTFTTDSINIAELTIAGNRIASQSVIITRNGSQLIVSGSLPFAWSSPFIPRDQPLNVSATLSDQDLSIVESYTKQVESASGALSANVLITGTLDDPDMDGRVSLANGYINLRGFENDFTDLTLNAVFRGSSLVIDELSGRSSLGGTFSAGGSISFADIQSESVSVLFTANAIRLSIVNITETLNERIRTTLSGQLTVTNSIREPSIQGQMVASDARIQVPARPLPTTVQIPQLPINPQLAITINLAQDVVIERGTLRAEIVGPLTLGGSLSSPVVAGTIQIVEGRIRYVGRSLDIIPGGTATLLFRPPQPGTLVLEMSLQTRVTTFSELSRRYTRYTITMDVSGPVGDLDIDVRSNPPGLSNLQALTSIFQGTAFNALLSNRPFEELFGEQLGQVVLGLAIPQLFESFEIGGIIFAVEPGFDIPLQVTASAPLTGNISLSYSRSIIGRFPIDLLSINYTLSPQLAINLQFEGQNGPNREAQLLISYYTRF
ncbi:MAG: translocation/assembly module TamB domain-containing protein [Armatimonadota bacterium]